MVDILDQVAFGSHRVNVANVYYTLRFLANDYSDSLYIENIFDKLSCDQYWTLHREIINFI